MPFTKIDNTDLVNKGVIGLPDTPGLSTAAMQAKLEETARDVIIPKHNGLIDELEDHTAAADLGADAPNGRVVTSLTVQGGLDKLSDDLATVEANISSVVAHDHTHANKALLDTYTQTEADLAQAVADDHTHSNKALLDTYTQSETDLADAVSKKHSHSNKALLDTYTQTETDIADAVSKKHAHSNKALLDTYTQTETDIADAVSKKHTHTNKTVIDKFGEDSGGNPTYDGNPIGGGGSGDTFKTIVSGGTSFVASGADTFKINAGSNVTITALSSPDKGISISATGGGSSTGDMLMSDYDQSGDVKAASSSGNGIKDFVAAEINKLDVSDSAVSGQYVSAVSETDGKISVTRASLPTVPTKVSDLTNDSGYQTASDVSTAISGKEDKSALKDLAYIAKDGVGSTKVLQGDGTWVTPSSARHTMISNNTAITSLTAKATDSTDDDVASGYAIANWSNAEITTLIAHIDSGDDTVGTWEESPLDWKTTGVRTGWVWHECLYDIVSDNEVEISIDFDVAGEEVVGLYAYRVDDNVTQTIGGQTVNGGAIAIKLTSAIQNASGVDVAINLKRQRTNLVTNPTILS